MRRTISRSAGVLPAAFAALILIQAAPGFGAQGPVPIGRTAAIGAHWQLQVLWRKAGARKRVPGLGTLPPAVVEHDLVRVKLTYLGPGRAQVLPVIENLETVGKRHQIYGADGGCNPPSGTDFPRNGYGTVRAGRSADGTLCFVIDARDSRSLELYALSPANTSYPPTYPPPATAVWFALR